MKALKVVHLPSLVMGSSGDLDSIYDEHVPAEVLEAVVVRFQRASVVFIEDAIQTDETTTCLALLGMRWLNKSEIGEDFRRRDLFCHSPGAPENLESAHEGGSSETVMPVQHDTGLRGIDMLNC